MKVISFSLWGDSPKYVVGAIRNAELAATVYPGWRCRFYCGASVPESALAQLRALPHVDIVAWPMAGDWTSLFWRFHATADPSVSVAVFRDCDSRLGMRERAAVDQWLASDRSVHVMRDHPWHTTPILGGLWGVRGDILRDIITLIDSAPRGDYWQVDQEFLASTVVPRVRDQWFVHDEYYDGEPFPTDRQGRAFVGQPFDADGTSLHDRPTYLEWRAWYWLRRLWHAVRFQ